MISNKGIKNVCKSVETRTSNIKQMENINNEMESFGLKDIRHNQLFVIFSYSYHNYHIWCYYIWLIIKIQQLHYSIPTQSEVTQI